MLPTMAIYGQCTAIYGNMLSAATRNILLYSARVLLYSARVGLYGVGGMRWEQVVVCKVLWGGPVIVPPF